MRRAAVRVPVEAETMVTPGRRISFDYSFRFGLTGEPGKVRNETVTVSIEGPFTAVSIGYGVIPETKVFEFGPSNKNITNIAKNIINIAGIRLGEIYQGLLDRKAGKDRKGSGSGFGEKEFLQELSRVGFRVNPKYLPLLLQAMQSGARFDSDLGVFNFELLDDLFQAELSPPVGAFQFRFALYDDGSGREFQSESLLSTSSLGSPEGERPFRHFARPVTFNPQSTIRMQVTEVCRIPGELHVTLHGFKSLGGRTVTAQGARRMVGRPR